MNLCYYNNCICGAQEMPGDLGCERSTTRPVDAHTDHCKKWMAQAPGQRGCVCHVGAGVPDDY